MSLPNHVVGHYTTAIYFGIRFTCVCSRSMPSKDSSSCTELILFLLVAGKLPLAFLVAVRSSSGLMRHSSLFVSKGSLAPAFV